MILAITALLAFINPPFEATLNTVETWKHDKLFGGKRFGTIVEPDGALLGQFQKDMPFMMTKKTVTDLRPMGQGPGDLVSAFGIDIWGDDLLVVEWTGKIKKFSKHEGAYELKESIHRRAEATAFQIDDVACTDDRIFIAGFSMGATEGSDLFTFTTLKAYERDGSFLGNVISHTAEVETFSTFNNWRERHLKHDGGTLFFMSESSLDLYVIDKDTFSDHTIVSLDRPSFYVPMPEDFFRIFDKRGRILDGATISKSVVAWRQGYSRVENLEVLDDHLVVQLRTSRPSLPRFALCFYSRQNDYALESTVYTDELLVGSLGDRLYLMKGGHPGIDDEELDQTVVRIVVPELH
jgi:hypothetical protein